MCVYSWTGECMEGCVIHMHAFINEGVSLCMHVCLNLAQRACADIHLCAHKAKAVCPHLSVRSHLIARPFVPLGICHLYVHIEL